jgi:hypothetical protein
MPMKIVRTFTATERDGTRHTIHELQGEHDIGKVFTGPRKARDAQHDLKTDDGRWVNYVSKGVYEIVAIPVMIRITSDDPNAP